MNSVVRQMWEQNTDVVMSIQVTLTRGYVNMLAVSISAILKNIPLP